MPNKLNLYIDPTKFQGAHLMNLKHKTGTPQECLVIVLRDSRIRRSEKSGRLGMSIDIIPNKDGRDEFGNTHWSKESTTKAERESPNPPNLPFLGNAREFEPGGQRQNRAPQSPFEPEGEDAGLSGDDIPF